MNGSFALAALGALSALSPTLHADETWFDDFDAAARAAANQGKDLLVDFTGSDWCGWCIKLDEEVFAHAEWLEAAQKDYVLVALDFPRGAEAKAKVPNPDRNAELQSLYGVRGFPTILLMTAEGEVYARTGYEAGGPQKYLEHMTELRAGREALVTTTRAVEAFDAAADDAGRWKAWESAVAAVDASPAGAPFLSKLDEVLRWGVDADADNALGHQKRSVRALLLAGLGDEGLVEKAWALDAKNEDGLLDSVVAFEVESVRDEAGARAAVETLGRVDAIGFKDQRLAFRMHFTAARWADGPLADPALKKKHAERAKEIGTDDAEMQKALEGFLG